MFKSIKKSVAIFSLLLVTLLVTSNTVLATTYVGSARSDKFHYIDCPAAQKIRSGNLIYFNSREAAINAGYIPCAICNP